MIKKFIFVGEIWVLFDLQKIRHLLDYGGNAMLLLFQNSSSSSQIDRLQNLLISPVKCRNWHTLNLTSMVCGLETKITKFWISI